MAVVSKSQMYLPNPSHVKKEDDIVEKDFSVKWAFPLIYDIYPQEDDLLNEVSISVDTVKFVDENDVYHEFDESSKSKVSELDLEKISFADFLRIENFLSSSPNNDFDVGLRMMKENFIFRGKEVIDPFGEVFMEIDFEKINKGCVKLELSQVGVTCFKIILCLVIIKLFFFLFVLLLRRMR